MMKTTKEVKKEEKEKFDLQEAFVLWRKEGKGITYYTGYDLNKNKMVAFENTTKKNEKEPDFRIYYENNEGKKEDKSCCGLWYSESKKGNKFLTGNTNENEKIIAFLGNVNEEKRPYIKAYFRKED